MVDPQKTQLMVATMFCLHFFLLFYHYIYHYIVHAFLLAWNISRVDGSTTTTTQIFMGLGGGVVQPIIWATPNLSWGWGWLFLFLFRFSLARTMSRGWRVSFSNPGDSISAPINRCDVFMWSNVAPRTKLHIINILKLFCELLSQMPYLLRYSRRGNLFGANLGMPLF